MNVGIVGCSGLSTDDAREFVKTYLATMRLKYPTGLRVVTVREDELGRLIRVYARRLNIRRRTITKYDFADQHGASQLAVGQMMWNCDQLVILDDGTEGLSASAIEIGRRLNKQLRIIDIRREK